MPSTRRVMKGSLWSRRVMILLVAVDYGRGGGGGGYKSLFGHRA